MKKFFTREVRLFGRFYIKVWAIPFFVLVIVMSFSDPILLLFLATGMATRYLVDYVRK